MKSEFDKIYDRRGSGAIKTDSLAEYFGKDDLIPLWVADMDFKTPEFILKAIKDSLDFPILGYYTPSDSYWNSFIKWQKKINDWEVTREQLSYIPGIVRGIAHVLSCFTSAGDRVVVQPPVYMPFFNLVIDNGREVVYNPLRYVRGQYEMDLNALESIFKTHSPKLMIVSNPHNPSGRVWNRATLVELAALCEKYNVILISDEIHADMPLFGSVHIPLASVSESAKKMTITFCAPSKTFNMAGMASSFAVVCDPELRERFFGYLHANEFNAPLQLSCVATEAAYSKGAKWRLKMLTYVEENVCFVSDYLAVNIPQISVVQPQASFLIWLNCKMLGLAHDDLIDLFVNKAGLALNDGEAFGPGGEGYMRLNAGCPRAILEKALIQLKAAVETTKSKII